MQKTTEQSQQKHQAVLQSFQAKLNAIKKKLLQLRDTYDLSKVRNKIDT